MVQSSSGNMTVMAVRVVQVERTASGNQLHQLGAVVVVSDVERNGQTIGVAVGAGDGKRVIQSRADFRRARQ